jgi:nitrogen regulatory protein PII
MIGAIFMATQANGALGRGRIFVPAVAQAARLMLGLRV